MTPPAQQATVHVDAVVLKAPTAVVASSDATSSSTSAGVSTTSVIEPLQIGDTCQVLWRDGTTYLMAKVIERRLYPSCPSPPSSSSSQQPPLPANRAGTHRPSLSSRHTPFHEGGVAQDKHDDDRIKKLENLGNATVAAVEAAERKRPREEDGQETEEGKEKGDDSLATEEFTDSCSPLVEEPVLKRSKGRYGEITAVVQSATTNTNDAGAKDSHPILSVKEPSSDSENEASATLDSGNGVGIGEVELAVKIAAADSKGERQARGQGQQQHQKQQAQTAQKRVRKRDDELSSAAGGGVSAWNILYYVHYLEHDRYVKTLCFFNMFRFSIASKLFGLIEHRSYSNK